ncbi:MAG: hypothetical protein KBT18_00345 [Comamonas sp.]|nr:hypothetical protein [Candidatus Comamonas equi]
MQRQTQRLIGVVLAIASAMLVIYGAFYYAAAAATGTFNVPLWMGVLGIVAGGALLVLGSRHTAAPG